MNKPTILVVEDDSSVRSLITTTLKAHGYKFLTAANGEMAVMMASSHNPDIMLLDLGLPDMDGTEIINGNPRHENHSDRGVELCRRHPNYFRLAGSDTHQDGDEARAGVILPERVRDSFQYKAMIESGNFRLWGPDFQDLIDIDEEMRQGK